jgi:hypothetical protein
MTLQPLSKGRRDSLLGLQAKAALPYHGDPPAALKKSRYVASIPIGVLPEFPLPEVNVRRRTGAPPAVRMAMPETTMNENYSSILRKHKIRLARQICPMYSVAVAGNVKRSTQKLFRLCVLPSNTSHHSRARRLIHNISQFKSLSAVLQCRQIKG